MKRTTKRADAGFLAEVEAMARRAWRERGIVILWPEQIRDAEARRQIISLAMAHYGKRKAAQS